MNEINWTDEQWKMMQSEIKSEIENSRLAHKIISKKKELPPAERAVSRDNFAYASGTVDETHDQIGDASEQVVLTKEQTADADLSTAKLIVRRAAQRLARRHDKQVFGTIRDQILKGQDQPDQFHPVQQIVPADGDGLIAAVSNALFLTDDDGYGSGFVMIAGHNVYSTMHLRVPGAADLPRVAIEKLLDSQAIHRSSVLDANEALVLSISGEEIDRAVALEPVLEFQRINGKDIRELRLHERFLTRFKQTRSVVLLRMAPKA